MMYQIPIFIYQLTIQIYGLLIRLAVLFNPKARLWVTGRQHIFNQLWTAFKTEKSPVIWMHCASLGEFEQGRPLLEQLKKEFPNYKILLTFFSPSGYEIRKNYEYADYIFYLPLDSPKNANKFLDFVKPQLVFFIKYEFWYFYLAALQKRGIKHFLIAGVFRNNQFFFRRYGHWYLKVIAGFNHLFLQDKASSRVIQKAGLSNFSVIGDPRVDRVLTIANQSQPIPIIQQFKADKYLFLLGSAHLKDIEIFFKFLTLILKTNAIKNWRFLVAPHEVDNGTIKQIEAISLLPTYRYSKIETIKKIEKNSIFILDTIGQLSTAYQYADAVFIGGGFDKGIHNILEPAVFGVPICFGPNYNKFQESKDLIALGGAFPFNSTKELIQWFWIINEVEKRKKIGAITKNYMLQNKGVTNVVIKYLNNKNILKAF